MKTFSLLVAASLLGFSALSGLGAGVPSATTGNPTSITTNSATLNGNANPNGVTTIAYFEWGTTTNYGSFTLAQSFGAGSSSVPVQANLSSLLTDMNYHYRLVASNALGITYGSDVLVTPTLLLYLYAGESWIYQFNDFSSTSLQFYNGTPFASTSFTIAPDSFAAGSSARFEMFENSTNDPTNPARSRLINAPASSTFLSEGGLFYSFWADHQGALRITAVSGSIVVSAVNIQRINPNGSGTFREFSYLSFTPTRAGVLQPPQVPQPPTLGAQFLSSVTVSSAVVTLDVNAKNLSTGTFVQWGTTTNYGSASGAALDNFDYLVRHDMTVSNLAPGATYHVRVVATNSAGATYGTDLTLTTLSPITVVTNLATDDVRGAIERGGSVTFACDGILVLSNQIEIANDVRLDASGHSITLSGNDATRIFKVLPGTLLTLTNITLANGRSTDGGGGAIHNDGTVVARDCQFLNNAVIGGAGTNGAIGANGTGSAAYNPAAVTAGQPGQNGGAGANAAGGAIFNSGTLTLWRCYFGSNSAAAGSGGNGGRGGSGGQTPIPGPTYGAAGGAGGGGGKGGKAEGGAIANFGILTLTSCTFSNSLILGGTGGMAGTGGNAGYIGISGGNGGSGGASGLANGSAVFTSGNARMSNSLFVANSTLAGSGGEGGSGGLIIPPGSLGPGGDGGHATAGGIFCQSNCILVNCTFNANTAIGGSGGAGASGFGNVAPAGNGGHAFGGGLLNGGAGQFINLTMSGNSAYAGSGKTNGNSYGGSIASTGGVFQIVNSIVAGGFSNNCFGVITDLGHNISSDATPVWTSGTSLNNTDPLLLPLANNGGPTLTMALRAGSPALNAADPAASPSTDQRGFARPSGMGYDIGAYEGAGSPTVAILRENSLTNVIRSVGEAGRSYRLEQTVTFGGWTSIATNNIPENGFIQFRVPVNPSSRFFRIVAE